MTAPAINWNRPDTSRVAEEWKTSFLRNSSKVGEDVRNDEFLQELGAFNNVFAQASGRLLSGASEADTILDSPNSLAVQLSALRARGFVRVNDPRRRKV
jgi:hypothetical protein